MTEPVWDFKTDLAKRSLHAPSNKCYMTNRAEPNYVGMRGCPESMRHYKKTTKTDEFSNVG